MSSAKAHEALNRIKNMLLDHVESISSKECRITRLNDNLDHALFDVSTAVIWLCCVRIPLNMVNAYILGNVTLDEVLESAEFNNKDLG